MHPKHQQQHKQIDKHELLPVARTSSKANFNQIEIFKEIIILRKILGVRI